MIPLIVEKLGTVWGSEEWAPHFPRLREHRPRGDDKRKLAAAF